MAEQFMSMADARRVAEGRKKIIDELKKRIETLESENKRLKSILEEHGINSDTENKLNLGLRVPTSEEVDSGQAQWCWTCGNTKCRLCKQDILMMCLFFDKRTKEDMEADPHFGGNENE